jgi:hypothetical protein
VRICRIIDNNLESLQTSKSPDAEVIFNWYEAALSGGFDSYQQYIAEQWQSQAAGYWNESETEEDRGSIRIALEKAFQALISFPLLARDLSAQEKSVLEKYRKGVKELAGRFYLPTEPPLPEELWVYIFSFLSVPDLLNIRGVNKQWQNRSATDPLWSSRLLAPIFHPPSEDPQELQAAIKRQILQNTRCFYRKPIKSYTFEVQGSKILKTWFLKDVYFVLVQRINLRGYMLYYFNLKKETVKKQHLNIDHELTHCIYASNYFQLIGERGNYVYVGILHAEGEVAYNPHMYPFADPQAPIKYSPYTPNDVFGCTKEGQHFVEFNLNSGEQKVYGDTYKGCDIKLKVQNLIGANFSFFLFLFSENVQTPLVLFCRKTMEAKTLPTAIGYGRCIEMTHNAIYVENCGHILRYDLHSETIHDLELDPEILDKPESFKTSRLKVLEFENKVIISCEDNALYFFERKDQDGNSTYVRKWRRPISKMNSLTPTEEFLIVKERGAIITLVSWTSGTSLNNPFLDALSFHNYRLATAQRLQTKETLKIKIEQF